MYICADEQLAFRVICLEQLRVAGELLVAG